ncbi:pDP71L [African swine fever virus]|uniref:PDP71L n=1 Tax=African swine fever virus TaxID=10497 RepID=A0A3G1EVD4_ASF|nr:pDP71L [African swine fever virus]AOO54533.1 pDP71L [African swine fever virus]QIM07808.1 pDP71L [African swine fever virus]QIM08509.1 pDP71L [African swine fever virus]QIM08975.1 pDP71L [African swine fever virus]QIM09441.1 pDP71L [African swine fever virus]
MLIVTIQK